jgi:Heparinase II/III N-terminus/Heparinase II/III-like protein
MVRAKSILNKISLIPDVFKAFGWRGILRRLKYVIAMRTGWYERNYPIRKIQPESGFSFPYSFELQEIRAAYQKLPNLEHLKASVKTGVQKLLNGTMLYFSAQEINIGWTPRWLENPATNKQYDPKIHWTHVPDLDPEMGDIKYTWEASRFGFVQLLARASILLPDDPYPEEFWKVLEGWIEQNPLQAGPNWRCGQETALRMMSVLFGLLTFASHPSTTQTRLDLVGAFFKASGHRILATLDYALSQRNNHALSEVVGLWTLAVLFPNWSESVNWKRIAEQKLNEVLNDQFYADGGYAQHSFNYQRLALHNLMWLVRIAKITNTAIPEKVVQILELNVKFLYAIQDRMTGWLPNYGANDGALIFSLSNMGYRDYRPTLQAAWYLLKNKPLYQETLFDEESIWFAPKNLLGNQQLINSMTDNGLHAFESGYFTSRGKSSFAFWRAAQFNRHRPGQADNLHVDIWMDGVNLALDPGTYAYNKPFPWNNSLGKTRVHNTANVNGKDQMTQVGRFLWSDWCQAKVLAHQKEMNAELWLLETNPLPKSYGYSKHFRLLLRFHDSYLIMDSIRTQNIEDISIHWNVPVLNWEEKLSENSLELSDHHFGIVIKSKNIINFTKNIGNIDKNEIQGWESPLYGVKKPCLSINATAKQSQADFFSYFLVYGKKSIRFEIENNLKTYMNEIEKGNYSGANEVLRLVNTYDLLD